MKECKIIRDLFPSYIDGLTNEETNQYIEEHLNNCENCKKILHDMKKELELHITPKDGKEVKYIKKYNNDLKILKTILTIIFLIFIISFARKVTIIAILNNKASDYMDSTNYYVKASNYFGDELEIIENYKKDNKYLGKYERLSHDEKMILSEYYNNGMINSYLDIQNYKENLNIKKAELNRSGEPTSTFSIRNIIPPIKTDNLFQFITTALFSNITTEEYNEKSCYRIVSGGYVIYIDKETGLTIRVIGDCIINKDNKIFKIVLDYEYEINTVTDDEFIEPDISEYEITSF